MSLRTAATSVGWISSTEARRKNCGISWSRHVGNDNSNRHLNPNRDYTDKARLTEPLQPHSLDTNQTLQRRRRSLRELLSQPQVTSLDSLSKEQSRSTWTGPILPPISSITEPPTKPLHPQVANRQREIQAKREAMKGKPEKEWLKTDGDVFGLEKK